jgi:uracil phosphoribosyltransferase
MASVASAAVLHPAPVGVELVARDETGSNAARHCPKLALADQGADVLLGAAELGSEVSNCQAIRLLHARSIALEGISVVN